MSQTVHRGFPHRSRGFSHLKTSKNAVKSSWKNFGGLFALVLTGMPTQRMFPAHTTSRVAAVVISFPTDLEKYMTARPLTPFSVIYNLQFYIPQGAQML